MNKSNETRDLFVVVAVAVDWENFKDTQRSFKVKATLNCTIQGSFD